MLLRSLIFTGAVNGLFFILLLKNKLKTTDSDKILMVWMAIVSLQLGFYYDNLSATPVFPAPLQLLSFSLPLINSPVLYFYIRSLSIGFSFKKKMTGIHLIPFLVFNGLTFLLHYTNNHYLFFKNALPHFGSTLQPWIAYFLTGFLAIVPGYYTFSSFLVLLRHQKALPDNYSYTEKINLNWLKWIVISLLVLFIGLFLFIKYGVSYGLTGYPNLFAIVGAIITVYVFFIGFCGLQQHVVVNHEIVIQGSFDEPDPMITNYKNSGLNDVKANLIFARLKLYMDEKKPFLKEDLSLAMLAAELDITSNQLSQVINQKSGANFFNFINGYRVEAVKNGFRNPDMAHYSILSIAYECGFRSKSSFNKIFKETTEQTPLDYRNTFKI